MRPFDPATRVQDYLVFGEFGDVNPSITDSSTYTFLRPETMQEVFEHEIEGCFLYSRHWNPTNKVLADALARMEDGESAAVMSSGMAAIATTLMLHCGAGVRGLSTAEWTAPPSGLFLERVIYAGDPPLPALAAAIPVAEEP